MHKSIFLILIIALLMALPGFAQETTMADVMAGKTIPLSLKLGQLDGSWRCMTPTPVSDAAEALVKMITAQMHQPLTPNTEYTRGQTLVMGGETYLIAYAPAPPPLPTREQLQQGGGLPAPLTADSEVFLTLLNIRTMGNLLNIHPFDLKQETAEKQGIATNDAQLQSEKNLRQLAIANMMYAQDHNEQFAAMEDPEQWAAALKIDKQLLTRPGTNELYQLNTALSKQALGKIADPTNTVLAFEATPWPDGTRCVAFVDGHVLAVNEQQWQALMKLGNNAGIPAQAMPTKEAEQQSLSKIRQLAVATLMYSQDNKNRFPAMDTAENWGAAVVVYVGNNKQMLTRPGMDELYQPNPALNKIAEADIKEPTNTVLAYEASPWPDGTRCVAFADGHAEDGERSTVAGV